MASGIYVKNFSESDPEYLCNILHYCPTLIIQDPKIWGFYDIFENQINLSKII